MRRASAQGRCYGLRSLMSASHPLDGSLIKALAHPLRWRILEILSDRGEASPVELARMLDQPLATVSHHTRVLRDMGSIELTRTVPRRGAVEHYYRPVMPTFFDDEQWARIPTSLRRGLAAQVFRRIFGEAAAAGEAGAFDAPGAHIDRLLVELDAEGRRELSDLLTEILKQAQAIQERSDARRGNGDAIHVSEVAILHFEVADSPPKRSPLLP
jgi:DNA-binding transcriptional ArsR family regulator